jgi:hypothetical protein
MVSLLQVLRGHKVNTDATNTIKPTKRTSLGKSKPNGVRKPLLLHKRLLHFFKKKSKQEFAETIHDDHLQQPEKLLSPHKPRIAATNSPGASPNVSMANITVRAMLSPSQVLSETRPSITRVSRRLSAVFASQESKSTDVLDIIARPSRLSRRISLLDKESEEELKHDIPYFLNFAEQDRLLTLVDENKVLLKSPMKAANKSQQWIVTDDGYIQSCSDPEKYLEIRNSVVQCNKKAPVKAEMDENEDIVSQLFDIVYTDPHKNTVSKYIRLRKNRKMVLGASRRVDSKLVLHILNNESGKSQKWFLRKCTEL